jgi:hypothetical protein
MKIETKMRYALMPVDMAITKKQKLKRVSEEEEKSEHLNTLV